MATVLVADDEEGVRSFVAEALETAGHRVVLPVPGRLSLEEIERLAIERALERHGGHRQRATDELGIGVRTLYEKLKHHGLG
jgi:DNA-binding NtrC family response regulator